MSEAKETIKNYIRNDFTACMASAISTLSSTSISVSAGQKTCNQSKNACSVQTYILHPMKFQTLYNINRPTKA
jgi:hypothetical protein